METNEGLQRYSNVKKSDGADNFDTTPTAAVHIRRAIVHGIANKLSLQRYKRLSH